MVYIGIKYLQIPLQKSTNSSLFLDPLNPDYHGAFTISGCLDIEVTNLYLMPYSMPDEVDHFCVTGLGISKLFRQGRRVSNLL